MRPDVGRPEHTTVGIHIRTAGISDMRVMGLDYGTKTVGVAISDALMLTAQPLETITRKSAGKLRRTYARIEAVISEYGNMGDGQEIGLIVLGYPKNMDDSEGFRCEDTQTFREGLERRTGLEVVLQDERLSTVEAEEVLTESGVRREDMKTYVDKIAAAVILQDYLDAHMNSDRGLYGREQHE